MWLEIVLSANDLVTILRQVTPITLRLGEHQWFALESPSEVALVPDVGLRVTCKARVKWPVLGVGVPVTIHKLVVTFAPEVVRQGDGDLFVFGLRLQHADFAGLPDSVDKRLSKAIDDALVARRLDLAWRFTDTLAGSIPLPATLDPIDGVSMKVAWGKVKVTDEAMVMALSVHHAFHRKGEAEAVPRPSLPEMPAQNANAQAKAMTPASSPDDSSPVPLLLVVGAGALAGGLLGAWLWRRR